MGVFISALSVGVCLVTADVCLVKAGVAGAVAAPVGAGATPAADGTPGVAGSSSGLMVTASGSTTVGLQVFANVNLTGVTNPTGTATFVLFGPGDSTCSATQMFSSTVAVTSTSVNSARYWATVAGTYRWQVTYSGDANNAPAGPSACANPSAQVVVGQAYSNISLTAMAPVGATLRASASVNGYSPTGSVTFYLSAPGDTFCSTTVFTSTVALGGGGTAVSAPYTATVAGQYRWRATYSGDTNNQYDPVTACLDPNAAVTVAAPVGFVYPLDGQTNVDTSQPFAWRAAPGAQGYRLAIGTTNMGSDLVDTAAMAATQTSYQAPPLPPGRPLYAAVYVETNGTWATDQAITFTAEAPWATFSYPVDGQSGVDTATAFRWQPSPQSQGYFLTVGSTYGGYDLLWSGTLPSTQTSYNLAALPAGNLHALLYTEIGGTWYGQAITFTANPTEAGLVTPTNNQGNVKPDTTFTWSTVAGVQSYTLYVGTTYLGADVANSGPLPATQSTYAPPGVPSGKVLYATIFTRHTNGATSSQTIAFTTGGPSSDASGLSSAGNLSPLLVP